MIWGWLSGSWTLKLIWLSILYSTKTIYNWNQNFIKNKIRNSLLCVSIRPRATVLRRAHLPFNPSSEEWDPAVDSVSPCQSALVTKTDVTDENMLSSTLVSQWTSGVALSEIFNMSSHDIMSHWIVGFWYFSFLTWQLSWPATPPAQIIPSVIVAKSAMAVAQVSWVTTGTSTSIKESG